MKKSFPLSFKCAKNFFTLLLGLIIYIVIGAVALKLIGLASTIGYLIPIATKTIVMILTIISVIIEFYIFLGIVILFLAFLGIIK